jgi:hypothetical protein
MRKSTLFISAVLTTFMLAVLFGVASAYQNIIKSSQPVAVQQTQPSAVEVINAPVVPTQVTNITPEAAATLASQVLNRTDLFSAEITQFDGADVYLITFSSGDLVYVSLDGQILSISKLPVTIVSQPASHRGGGNNQPSVNDNSSNDNNNNDGEHEGGDD